MVLNIEKRTHMQMQIKQLNIYQNVHNLDRHSTKISCYRSIRNKLYAAFRQLFNESMKNSRLELSYFFLIFSNFTKYFAFYHYFFTFSLPSSFFLFFLYFFMFKQIFQKTFLEYFMLKSYL